MAQDDPDDRKQSTAPPHTISTRGVWSAIGDLRDEFADHRKEDRDDFKAVLGKLDEQGKAIGDIRVIVGKLDTERELRVKADDKASAEKALAVRASTEVEETKRVKLTTAGRIVVAILALIAAALGIAGGAGLSELVK